MTFDELKALDHACLLYTSRQGAMIFISGAKSLMASSKRT